MKSLSPGARPLPTHHVTIREAIGALGLGALLVYLALASLWLSAGLAVGVALLLYLRSKSTAVVVQWAVVMAILGVLIGLAEPRYLAGMLRMAPVLRVVRYSAVVECDRQTISEVFVVERLPASVLREMKEVNPSLETIIEEFSVPVEVRLVGGEESIRFPFPVATGVQYSMSTTRPLPTRRAGFLVRKCELTVRGIRYRWSQTDPRRRAKITRIGWLAQDQDRARGRVEMRLPKNSFLGANVALNVSRYGDVDVAFGEVPFDLLAAAAVGTAFIDPPFNRFRRLVEPVAGAASASEVIMVAVGLTVPFLAVLPVLAFRDVLKGWWVRVLSRKRRGVA